MRAPTNFLPNSHLGHATLSACQRTSPSVTHSKQRQTTEHHVTSPTCTLLSINSQDSLPCLEYCSNLWLFDNYLQAGIFFQIVIYQTRALGDTGVTGDGREAGDDDDVSRWLPGDTSK
jgi:hypothetical protein